MAETKSDNACVDATESGMGSPIYVVQTNETVKIPGEKKQPFAALRIVVWVIVGVIIVGPLVFGESLLSDMPGGTKAILFALVVGSFFWGPKSQPVASAIEIRFYDDYLVVYREKRYYDRKTSRREFNKFFYKDIEGIDYSYRLKRLNILGTFEATWFDYNKDGSVPVIPTYHRTIKGGICYFYVYGDDADEILGLLERFTSRTVERKHAAPTT